MSVQFEVALKEYKTALEKVESTDFPSQEQSLAVLAARDVVYEMQTNGTSPSAEQLIQIWQVDNRLKQQARRITQVVKLADWRSSVYPPQETWWWFLEDIDPLNEAVKRYEQALDDLKSAISPIAETTGTTLSVEPFLEVFLARDVLQNHLGKDPPSSAMLIRVGECDRELKHLFGDSLSTQSLNSRRNLSEHLEDLRDVLKPSETAWWWFQKIPIRWWDRLDLAWNTLTLIWLAATFSLLMDISTRFLSGGPGTFGAFAVIFQSALALAGGGALTKTGQAIVDRSLQSMRVPRHLWQEYKFGAATLLLLTFVGFRLALPWIAVKYNNSGFEDYIAGQLGSAEAKYKRALELAPNYAEAHYNLGLLYEDLQNLDQARTEYSLAVKSQIPMAHNNLGRLHILSDKPENYPIAVNLLAKGIALVENDPNIVEGRDEVRYSLYKNMGWVRLKQGRYEEAKVLLERATSIPQVKYPAAANCLLAQTLEKLPNSKRDALSLWQRCEQSAKNPDAPEEDGWIHQAQQKLNAAKKKP